MFDNNEYGQLLKIHMQCIETIKEYRQSQGKTLPETPLNNLYKPLYLKYRELTGIESDFSAEEIMRRHYLKRWKEYQHEAEAG